MNIFQLKAVVPSKVNRPKVAPRLECGIQDRLALDGLLFRGQPYPKRWRRRELTFGNNVPWDADFYSFGPGAIVCSERARSELAPLEDEGEFLPVTIKEATGIWYLYNATNCRSFLNTEKTVWKNSKDVVGPPRKISKYVFWAERIGGECLFKIQEEGAINLYCIERTGDPFDGEFKAISKANSLTGLSYIKIWSGGRG